MLRWWLADDICRPTRCLRTVPRKKPWDWNLCSLWWACLLDKYEYETVTELTRKKTAMLAVKKKIWLDSAKKQPSNLCQKLLRRHFEITENSAPRVKGVEERALVWENPDVWKITEGELSLERRSSHRRALYRTRGEEVPHLRSESITPIAKLEGEEALTPGFFLGWRRGKEDEGEETLHIHREERRHYIRVCIGAHLYCTTKEQEEESCRT